MDNDSICAAHCGELARQRTGNPSYDHVALLLDGRLNDVAVDYFHSSSACTHDLRKFRLVELPRWRIVKHMNVSIDAHVSLLLVESTACSIA